MLKRYQVLLEGRTAEHLKEISNKYDISFSEAIRILLALQIPKMISIAFPNIKCVSYDEDMVHMIKLANQNKATMENFHKLLSKVYFESRKSIEPWFDEEQKRLKKSKSTQK